MLILNIQKRDPKDSLDEIRERDDIPAVFYGKGIESTPIFLSYSDFKRVWKEAGTSSLIQLKGVEEDREVIIQDLAINPITSQVSHVDFYVVERGKKMETSVPLEFVSESPAVKNLGGILVKVMQDLNIAVLPKDLPQNIEVDISPLTELDSQILVKDLKLPEGVEVIDSSDEVVAAVSQASEEEEVPSEPVDISQVEIEKKGKKEEEGEGEENKK